MAIVAWLAAGLLGLNLLLIWLKGGGLRSGRSHLRPSVVFAHVMIAVAGLALLVAYLLNGRPTWLAWATVAVIVTSSILGAVMYISWWRGRRQALRARAAALAAAGGAVVPRPAPSGAVDDILPVERRFSSRVVLAHGLVADLTLALVLLVALGVGS
jgi:hypothetical protein